MDEHEIVFHSKLDDREVGLRNPDELKISFTRENWTLYRAKWTRLNYGTYGFSPLSKKNRKTNSL